MNGVRAMRERAGITQSELAVRTGIAQSNISAYESGRVEPSPDSLTRISAATKIRAAEILRRHRDSVVEVAANNHASNVRVFGSIARGEDGPESDIDLLVHFDDEASVFDLTALAEELTALLRTDVDVVSDRAFEQLPAEAMSV